MHVSREVGSGDSGDGTGGDVSGDGTSGGRVLERTCPMNSLEIIIYF